MEILMFHVRPAAAAAAPKLKDKLISFDADDPDAEPEAKPDPKPEPKPKPEPEPTPAPKPDPPDDPLEPKLLGTFRYTAIKRDKLKLMGLLDLFIYFG